jgi:L-threonylcarbamoyladenylate synthase
MTIKRETLELNGDSPGDIERAAEMLRSGKLVAFPTETVYGLGAGIFIPQALHDIFVAKGRPQDNPLITHIAHPGDAALLCMELTREYLLLSKHFFPGPLTLVLAARPELSRIATGGLDTVAIRMPDHPVALQLIEKAGMPVCAPSANLSGRPSPTTAAHVLQDLGGHIDAVLDGGPCSVGIESTVLLLSHDKPIILRPGSIHAAQISEVLGYDILEESDSGELSHHSPGTRYRHYAPAATVHLVHDMGAFMALREKYTNAFVLSDTPVPGLYTMLEQSRFYADLRLADSQGYTDIVILLSPFTIKTYPGLANRVMKSAGLA